MLVKGKRIITENIQVDISPEEVKNILSSAVNEEISAQVKARINNRFVYECLGLDNGKNVEVFKSADDPGYYFMSIGTAYNHHSGVDEDEFIRYLTGKEVIRYISLREAVEDLTNYLNLGIYHDH